MATIKVTDAWRKRAPKLLTAGEREALIAFLEINPDAGDIVAGTGGVRKLRWGIAGQGKHGGARVLHLFLKHRDTLWLLDIYGKRAKADLSPADVRAVWQVVNAIKRASE